MKLKLLAFGLSVILGACTCAVENSTVQDIEPTVKSQLRIINASSGAPALNCLDNDKIRKQSVAFTDTSSGYFDIGSGVRNIRLTSAATGEALLSILSDFAPKKPHTIIAMGVPTSMLGLALRDEPPQPITGKSFIRFIHASMAAGMVDVSAGGGGVIFSKKTFQTFTEYTAIDAGNSSLTVVEQTTNATYSVSFQAQEGKNYTILLKSDATATGNERLHTWVVQD